MAYDSQRERLVVCGRFDDSGNVETWFFSADQVWSQGPSAATGFEGKFIADPELAYDPVRDRIVLYTATDADVETWELNGNTWSKKSPATRPTPCPDGALFEYDPNLQACVLVACNGLPEVGKPTKTWLWNGTNWSLLSGTSPSGGAGGGMAYDAQRDEMVLVTRKERKTWALKNSQWTQKQPPQTIEEQLWLFGMAYDPVRREIVVYGGESGEWPGLDYPDDTWAWNGSTWAMIETIMTPGPVLDCTFEYFPPLQGIVLHGGWAPPDWVEFSAPWLLPSPQEIGRIDDLSIRIEGEYLTLEWSELPQINSYQVYSAPSAQGPFTPATDAPIQRNHWQKHLWELYPRQQFYYVEPVIP
jgi:hypothetical protein